jgi:hypothetical protein
MEIILLALQQILRTVSACAAAAGVRCLTSTLFEITLWRAVDVLRGVVDLWLQKLPPVFLCKS